jgi:hypothetical protein
MTAPTIRDTTSFSGAGTLVIDKPTGTVSGDILLWLMGNDGTSNTWSSPSGWTEIFHNRQSNGTTTSLFYKVAGGSEPSTYTNTRTGEVCGSLMTCIAGADDLDVSSVADEDGSDNVATTPTVTTTVADCTVIRMASWNGGDDPIPMSTTETGYTKMLDVGANSGTAVGMFYNTYASAGATGTMDIDLSGPGTTDGHAITVAFSPSAAVSDGAQFILESYGIQVY